MEIIKELPEVFEEFAEQRKNSFLAVKELKDKGVPVVGAYCTYFPQRLHLQWALQQWDYVLRLTRLFQKQKKICRKTYVH